MPGLGPLGSPVAPNRFPTPARSNPVLVLLLDLVPDLVLSARNSIPALARQGPGEEAEAPSGPYAFVQSGTNNKAKSEKYIAKCCPNLRKTLWLARRQIGPSKMMRAVALSTLLCEH